MSEVGSDDKKARDKSDRSKALAEEARAQEQGHGKSRHFQVQGMRRGRSRRSDKYIASGGVPIRWTDDSDGGDGPLTGGFSEVFDSREYESLP